MNNSKYVPYLVAKKLLVDRLGATPEEIAGWLHDGWHQDTDKDSPAPAHILRAYTHVHDMDTPIRFVLTPPLCIDSDGVKIDLSGCYFVREEINQFSPNERYITAPALIEKLAAITGSREDAESIIQSRVFESRLMGFHPRTGLTKWDDPDPKTNSGYAPKDQALFPLSKVAPILDELAMTADDTATIAQKAQRDEIDRFYDDYEKLERKIACWENANAPTVLDMAKREEILAPLKARFDAMDLKRRQMLGDPDADDKQDKDETQDVNNPTPLENWMMRVQAEAASRWQSYRSLGCNSTKNMLKDELALWCRESGVKTKTGINPTAEYIYRHALRTWAAPD